MESVLSTVLRRFLLKESRIFHITWRKNSTFLTRYLHKNVTSECRILHLIFQNFLGGACPQTSLAGSDHFVILTGDTDFIRSSTYKFRLVFFFYYPIGLVIQIVFGTDCKQTTTTVCLYSNYLYRKEDVV